MVPGGADKNPVWWGNKELERKRAVTRNGGEESERRQGGGSATKVSLLKICSFWGVHTGAKIQGALQLRRVLVLIISMTPVI